MRHIYLIILLVFTQNLAAQTEDAWVFFADKENVTASIANPITILTQEAIDRKNLHGIQIDERDVPITSDYILDVANSTGIEVMAQSKWFNCVHVRGTQADIENLMNLAFVESLEYANKGLNKADLPFETNNKFEEPYFNRTDFNYGAASNQIEMLSGDFLHQQNYTGQGMIIAVLDAGFPDVDTNPAFSKIMDEDRLLGTYDFVLETTDVTGTGNHGVKTFSDIGGFLQDEFVGTAPDASFYLFRTEFAPTENPVEESYWVEALERSDSLGVDVVNTSLGYQDYDNPNYDHSYEDLDGQTTFAARGANHAFDKGLLLVTSAGNDGNGFMFVGTPADAPGVLTIGAVDANGDYVNFSSRGPTVDGRIKPDVMAQGAASAVVGQTGNVVFNNGTSFSSPITAGVVACLWQAFPDVNNQDLMQAIRESGSIFNNPTDQMGYGIPNFESAFNALSATGIEEVNPNRFALYPNPVFDALTISFPMEVSKSTIHIYDILGKKIMSQTISDHSNQLNIASLSKGVYIAIIDFDRSMEEFKLIKN